MALYHDEGVVLRTAKLGEADNIVTLFTRDHGKVRAVARGVRRTKSRFGGRLEPFMRVDLLLGEGRTFDAISQAESVAAYPAAIIGDMDAYAAANAIAETLNDLAGTEHEPAPAQYRLLVGALHALAARRHAPRAIAGSYVLRALSMAGWTPRLDTCVVCGGREDLTYFSPAAGGAMCTRDHTPDAARLSDATRRQLVAMLAGDWATLDAAPLEAAALPLAQAWAEYYLERPLRSLRLLD
ncbi:MAG: DNA repair protein RecO [Bifidobacterium sp.]|nr:DNA repair protein RecO [Bifidobacterium sp.]